MRKDFYDKIHGGVNLRVDIFILVNPIRAGGLLLYVLALPFARVVNGAVSHKLARKHRFYTRKYRRHSRDNNFADDRIFA